MRLPLLIVHVSAGLIGLFAGALAISYRKGSDRHRLSGDIFAIAMLIMAAAAACLAFMKRDTNNIFGGLLTIYLIATAWQAGSRRTADRKLGIFDWVGFLFALVIGALSVIYGLDKATGRVSLDDGVPFGMDLFLGSVMLLAAAGDLRMLVRGGIFGAPRIARHLWRMCFALFIASGSFFLGQGAKVFPAWLIKTNVLIIPALLPLVLLLFWLFRVRFTNRYGQKQVVRGSASVDRPLAILPHHAAKIGVQPGVKL
jgi:uncharacterized membrane protein